MFLAQRKAQAVIEFIIVLPVIILIILSFLGIQIRMEAQTELDAAVSLAAAADAAAPAGVTANERGGLPNANAQSVFGDTIGQYSYFAPFSRTQASGKGTYLTGCGSHTQSQTTPVTCTGHAYITWINITGISFATNLVQLTSTADAYPSTHRVCVGNIGPC